MPNADMPKEVLKKVGPEIDQKLASRHLGEFDGNRFFEKSYFERLHTEKDDQQQPENGLANKLLASTNNYLSLCNPPHDKDTLWQKLKYQVLRRGEAGRERALHNLEFLEEERSDFELLAIIYPQLEGWKVPKTQQHAMDPKLDSSYALRLFYFHAVCEFFKVKHTSYDLAFMICEKYSGLTRQQISDFAAEYAARHTIYAFNADPAIESEHRAIGLEKLALRVLQDMELKEIAVGTNQRRP